MRKLSGKFHFSRVSEVRHINTKNLVATEKDVFPSLIVSQQRFPVYKDARHKHNSFRKNQDNQHVNNFTQNEINSEAINFHRNYTIMFYTWFGSEPQNPKRAFRHHSHLLLIKREVLRELFPETGLYCTKWVHSHLLFSQFLFGVCTNFSGLRGYCLINRRCKRILSCGVG